MLTAAADIQGIPTLMIFRDGILLHRESGALPRHALDERLSFFQALDMDAVRAEFDAQEAGQSEDSDQPEQ
jgi:thioredoxin 1